MFEKILYAGWSDIDANNHMGNTAYMHKALDVRMMYFAENGFPAEEFALRRLGPVIMKDEIEYFKEVRLLEKLRVTYFSAGNSADFSRFIVRNELWREDGKLVARITSTGGWLDLEIRKLIVPPPELQQAMRSLARSDDYQVLPSSLK